MPFLAIVLDILVYRAIISRMNPLDMSDGQTDMSDDCVCTKLRVTEGHVCFLMG